VNPALREIHLFHFEVDMSIKSWTPKALFGLSLVVTSLNAVAASVNCPDPQVIRYGTTTANITNWSADSSGHVTAKLDGTPIEGRCSADSTSIELTIATNPKQIFSGQLVQTCGEPAFQGTVESSGTKQTWFSIPRLKRTAQTCASKLPTIPDGHATQADCVPTLKTEADVVRGQCLLRKLVWGPSEYPLKQRPTSIDRNAQSPFFMFFPPSIEHWTLSQPFGFESNIYFFKADHPNGKLAVFQQGHRPDYDACGGGDTIKFFLKNGYDVVALLMPAFGPNLAPTEHDPGNHNSVFTVTKDYNPLRLFLEPVVVSLNEALARKSYSEVVMTGVSGGGWTTAWLAALESRITVAIPVAGSFPMSERGPRDMGDQEQFDFGTYTYVGYNDIYVIGAHKKKYLQISNAYDKCCFAAPNGPPGFVPQVKAAAASSGGSYQFAIDSSHRKHMISPWQLENLFTPLLDIKTK
jgi:hypothetical protein